MPAPRRTPPDQETTQLISPSALSRRGFMQGVGSTLSAATALLSGCTRAPSEKIVPYRVQPEEVVVGQAARYATTLSSDGYATGLLVTSHEGRPTKVEGNPDHPASLGASNAQQQAATIELYSPRRQRALLRQGRPASWAELGSALRAVGEPTRRGRGLHLVLPATSSALVSALLERLRLRLPELRVHFHTSLSRARAWRGAQAAYGSVLEVRPNLRRADLVVSLDADVLASGPDHLARAREFADRRRMLARSDGMNRLYVVEATPSVTGQMADHRLALKDSALPAFTAALLQEVARGLGEAAPSELRRQAPLARDAAPLRRHEAFARALARDLVRVRSASVVLVGDRQPACVHAAAHALNWLLGSVESSVCYAPSPITGAGESEHDSLAILSAALEAREVESLITLESDVAYGSPAELLLAARLPLAKSSFCLSTFDNATAQGSEWRIPAAHWLESWGDARSLDGTASLIQPLIAPLYAGRTASELLGLLLGELSPSAHAQLRQHVLRDAEAPDAEWERSLARGALAGSAFACGRPPPLRWGWLDELLALAPPPEASIELSLVPDARLLDGRFADNPWLLELPDPVTKLTWSNAALLAPATATRLGVSSGDVVKLSSDKATLAVPALVVPGQAENSVGLQLGWGQPLALASRGANAFALCSSAAPWFFEASLEATGGREELAISQAQMSLEGLAESIAPHATLSRYLSEPDFCKPHRKKQPSLYPPPKAASEHQWGMAIDLNVCTGCSSCVLACQAENNIPTVGWSGVLKHREMHWLRVDRYLVDAGATLVQPMACQHCETAPCEYVCPTGATLHSADGLNQMVYNRCVGTRFCSNNCPYKVRRFNWFNYHADQGAREVLVYNPDVTVRARGVMEKCTYCVQRIRKAEICGKIAARPLVDGDVVTACEQACPTGAIVFGDLSDSASRVRRLHDHERAFEVLNELGTVPRTRYLAKLTNPNPEIP